MEKPVSVVICEALSLEEEERCLGSNVFGIDILFDGDFATTHPMTRHHWTMQDVQQWNQMLARLREEAPLPAM